MPKNIFFALMIISTFGCVHAQNTADKNPRAPAATSEPVAPPPICLPVGNLCNDKNHQMILDATDGAKKRVDQFEQVYGKDLTLVPAHPEVLKAIDEFNKSTEDMRTMYLRSAVDKAINSCQVTTSGTDMAELLQEKAVQEGMNCGFGDMAELASLQAALDDMRLNFCFRSMKALTTLSKKTPKMKETPMIARFPEAKTPKALDLACKKQLDADRKEGANEAPIYYAGCMSSWRSEYMATIIGQLRKFRSAIPSDLPL